MHNGFGLGQDFEAILPAKYAWEKSWVNIGNDMRWERVAWLRATFCIRTLRKYYTCSCMQ